MVVRLVSAEYTLNRYLEWAFWALIIGLAISNTVGVPKWLRPAIRTEFYIKTGLVIMGFSILFTWQTFARRKWTYQNMLVIAFSCFAFYLTYFYFRIDYNIPKESLYLPVIARSAGYVMVAVMMLTANARLPFPFIFLHGLSFQNMFSAALAAPIGNAIVGRTLKAIMTRNTMLLSQNMDSVTLSASRAPMGELYGMVQVQSLMESMKEVYGLLLFVAILCLVILLVRYSSFRPLRVMEPTYRFIYNFCKNEVFARLCVRRVKQVS